MKHLAVPIPRHWFVSGPGLGFRLRGRLVLLNVLALGTVAATALAALGLGTLRLDWGQILGLLAGNGDGAGSFVFFELRLPRVLCALLAGAMLACSGLLFQGLARNPLASPDIIGINSGASLAAVAWIVFHLPAAFLPGAALAGAMATALSVYLLSWKGRLSLERLVLVGIGANALANAGITFVLLRGKMQDSAAAYHWMAGSFHAASPGDAAVLAAALAAAGCLVLPLLPTLRLLQLGDHPAKSAGLAVEPARLVLLALACLLAAVAVSVAGPIGFVALLVPHLTRTLTGAPGAGQLVFTALVGGLVTLLADMAAQHALGVVLPAGVVSAAAGSPAFLVLLVRSRHKKEINA